MIDDSTESYSRRKIQRMTERLLNGEMSQEEFELFESILLNDDAARLAYVEHVSVHAHLSHLGGAMDTIEDEVFSFDEHAFLLEPRRRSSFFLTASVAMLVACLFVVPWFGLRFVLEQDSRLIGQLTAEPSQLEKDIQSSPPSVPIRMDEPLDLEAGNYSLRLKSGVRCQVVGPARLMFASGMEADLQSGMLLATVPRQAVGFRVNTPDTRVLDLGTTFSVEVTPNSGTDVSVFDGLVVVQPQADSVTRGSLPILSGQSLSFSKQGVETKRSPQPEMLRTLGKLYGIEETSGAVVLNVQTPESVDYGRLQHDSVIYAIRESSECVLPAPLDVVAPDYRTITTPGVASTRLLPRGTRCESFLLHCDFATGKTPIKGTIRFERPILGVIYHSEQLQRTDSIFGSAKIKYPTDEAVFSKGFSRGSIAPYGGKQELHDSITVHQDGRGLTVQLYSPDGNIDQVRVLVQAADP